MVEWCFFLDVAFFGGRGAKPLHILIIIDRKSLITGSQNDKSIEIDRLPFLPDHDNTSRWYYKKHVINKIHMKFFTFFPAGNIEE